MGAGSFVGAVMKPELSYFKSASNKNRQVRERNMSWHISGGFLVRYSIPSSLHQLAAGLCVSMQMCQQIF
jgi:hypothetical protein